MQRVVFHEIKSFSVTQGPEQLCEHQRKTEFSLSFQVRLEYRRVLCCIDPDKRYLLTKPSDSNSKSESSSKSKSQVDNFKANNQTLSSSVSSVVSMVNTVVSLRCAKKSVLLNALHAGLADISSRHLKGTI